jgi:hypothetical protein
MRNKGWSDSSAGFILKVLGTKYRVRKAYSESLIALSFQLYARDNRRIEIPSLVRSQLLMLFISRRRLCRAGEKARLMLTRRMSLDPDSLSTLSMLLFNGLMAEAFCGLGLCGVVDVSGYSGG